MNDYDCYENELNPEDYVNPLVPYILFGITKKHTKITIKLGKKEMHTTTNEDGQWVFDLVHISDGYDKYKTVNVNGQRFKLGTFSGVGQEIIFKGKK
jgi:hypothetical protein